MIYSEAEAYSRIYGDAFYIFDETRFVANYNSLLSAFRRHYAATRIAYSYKTNYTPAICRRVDELGGYAEVVSEMEYALARRVGVRPERIVYNGPWKSETSMHEALVSGSIVNLDSDRDLELLKRFAAQASGAKVRAGIRCNFPLDGYPESRFGFDVDGESFRQAIATIRRLPNVVLAGLHCHFPHRELRSFSGRADQIIEVAQRLFDVAPEYISIGGGFFGQMPESMKGKYADGVPSFEEYGKIVGGLFASAYGSAGNAPILFIEPGTAVVADTFSFIARIIDVKRMRLRNLACVAGSMFNVSPYSRSQVLPVKILHRVTDTSAVPADAFCDLVGYTCIEGDVLSQGVPGPVSVDDFVVFNNVGSYSVVMKPPFILPNVPIVMRLGSGETRLVKRAETNEYLFENFVF